MFDENGKEIERIEFTDPAEFDRYVESLYRELKK